MIFDKNFKKFFVFNFCLLALSLPVFSLDTIASKLGEIEKSLYGYTYSGSNETRLSRLEKNLYGRTYSGSQKIRAEKIYKDMSLGSNTGAAAPVIQNTKTTAPVDIGPKAEAGIKYPVVDKLEQKVFKKSYVNDDIYIRLSRLEKQVFKKESTLSLNERVDALRDKLLGGERAAAADIDPATEEIVLEDGSKYKDDNVLNFGQGDLEDSHYNYYSYEKSKNHIPKVQSQFDEDTSTSYAPTYSQNYDLDILEKQLFGKRFIQEPPSQRLARLENKVFQRTFNDNQEARTQRLLAVTTAQKTSKEYDSNKWAQRINTGIQIGSILLMVLAMIL